MVDRHRWELFGERAHFRRQSVGGGGVNVDEKVEFGVFELFQRNEIIDAFEEARLSEGAYVGRGDRLLARGAQHARQRYHGA